MKLFNSRPNEPNPMQERGINKCMNLDTKGGNI